MPRYIDADALLLKVQVESTEASATDLNNEGFVAFCKGVRKIVEKSINEMQTADAQKVKHGTWEEHDYIDDVVYTCSVCGEDWVTLEGTPADNLWNYCPNCGARMGGDKK